MHTSEAGRAASRQLFKFIDSPVRDGLHLSGKGAAVFAEGLSGAVASGLGKVRYLN